VIIENSSDVDGIIDDGSMQSHHSPKMKTHNKGCKKQAYKLEFRFRVKTFCSKMELAIIKI
jgi:hypothetical protein